MGGRRSQQDRSRPLVPAEELLDVIIQDVIETADMSWEEWRTHWEHPFTPMAIPTSDGRQYQCTRKGVNAAHALTAQAWDADAGQRAAFTREAFDGLAFKSIGDAVSACRIHLPDDQPDDAAPGDDFYRKVADDFRRSLSTLTSAAKLTLDRHIPCHVFHRDQEVPAFSVGPVTFRPRSEWVDRFVVDPPVRNNLAAFEAGAKTREDLRHAVQAGPQDAGELDAIELIDFLGNHGWVATVRIDGSEAARGHEKASAVVGLALDALGLRFTRDDARAFSKAGQQHHFNEARLASNEAGQFAKGWRMVRPGLGGPPGALATRIAAEQPFLDQAGTLLSAYLDARSSGRALHVVERWVNALHWFGSARREVSDFVAAVDYGCAIDGLSGAGGDLPPMVAFAEAVLRPDASTADQTGLTVREAVTRVYADGRNKLAHGEEPGLLEDRQEVRLLGDTLVALLLNEVTPVLARLLMTQHRMLELDEKRFYRALVVHLAQRPIPTAS